MTNELKIERLTNWINEQVQWVEDYQDHEDNINSYAECFEKYNLFYGEIDEEYRDTIKTLFEKLDAYDILELCDEPFYHHGISRCTNEIWSMNIGEVGGELTGVYDSETKNNCVFTDLCQGLSEDEIKQAKNNSDAYIDGNYFYIDRSHDRVSICVNIDKVLEYLENNKVA